MENGRGPRIQVGSQRKEGKKDSGPGEVAGREQGGEGMLGTGGLFEGLREAGEDGERRRVPGPGLGHRVPYLAASRPPLEVEGEKGSQ